MKLVDDQITKRRTKRIKVGKNKYETQVKPGPDAQVALIAMDPHTGEVLALVGGRNYAFSQLDHAVARRPTGSIFKPFVYAAALNTALDGTSSVLTPASTVPDQPSTFSYGDQIYEPRNYKEEYHGDVTLRYALALSLNNATVKVAEAAGYDKVAELARNAGIIPGNLWGAPKDLAGYSYDLAKAKEHLGMVKAPMRPLEIGVLAGFDQSEAAAQLLQAGAAKIGIEIKLASEPWPVISGKFGDPDKTHDLVPLWRSAYFADPHNWTGAIYNSRNIGAGNSSFYKNAKFDDLTDKALVMTQQEQRQPLYEEASRSLVEDAAGLFIYNTKWYGPFTKNVHDVRFCPIGDAQDLRWIEMEG